MTDKKYPKLVFKENSFDAAPGGMAGSINYQPSLGTHSSPSNYQNPAKFNTADYNKYYNKDTTGQPDVNTSQKTSGSFDNDIENIFKQKKKATIDDFLCGIEYELQRMTTKSKGIAKQRVIDNMKKYGAKYYASLQHMNIDDKKMDVNPLEETVKVLNQMILDKESKRERFKLNTETMDILKEKKKERFGGG